MSLKTNNKDIVLIIILLITSVSFNQYYGNIGVQPIDSFFPFNSGYDVLNGNYPFKDYWTITGPFLDIVQAAFFKLFNVSWFSYVLHASIFNFVFTIYFFYVLKKFKLNLSYCFLYALCLSILAYPSAGTPYVDHQSSYMSTMAILCFIYALKFNSNLSWFFLPIIIGLSFLTKQAPTGYIFLLISFLSLIYFLFNFNLKNILFGLFGSISVILFFFLFLFLGKIPLTSFVEQYILFPISFGGSRLGEGFLFPLEFQRIIMRFKLIHLSWIILGIVIIKNSKNNYKYFISNEFLILFSLIALVFLMIGHQLMTINGLYIFFLIPILLGFSHIYFEKYFKKKTINSYFLLTLLLVSTIYYGFKYIDKRNFMDLDSVNISKAINANSLDEKLNGLKWITPQYPDNPSVEIENLKKILNILEKDNTKKIIVTDYQFISVILSQYDNSPNKVWYSFHVYPSKNDKYFKTYKNFFIKKIKERNIETVYTIKHIN